MATKKIVDKNEISESKEVSQVGVLNARLRFTQTAYGLLMLLLILVASGGIYYFYSLSLKTSKKYDDLNKKYIELRDDPTKAAQDEADALVKEVGKLITLPEDEVPTIASVLDKSALADQPFFVNAENGDKLLIYSKAKKAILYRPSVNKIIEVAPLTLDNTSSSSLSSSSSSSSSSSTK